MLSSKSWIRVSRETLDLLDSSSKPTKSRHETIVVRSIQQPSAKKENNSRGEIDCAKKKVQEIAKM